MRSLHNAWNLWRKVLQIFKQKKYLTFSASFILFSGISFISAQSMPKMPEMPAFPEITTPSTDSGFYKPSIPNYPKKPSSPSVTEQTKSTQQEQILTDSKKTSDLLNLFNSTDMLTASDISSLSSSGLFSNLSSLYGNSSSLNESSNQVLLEQILDSLNDLHKIQNENTSSKTSSLESAFKDREPSILRFKINGYDIKDSLTTVYFSKPEADGSFLLTADRRYISGNKMLNETFYFLFKSKEGL